jgi:hypothetical protein
MMIEKYQVALEHKCGYECLPLHIECKNQCRLSIISKCIELYPEALATENNLNNLPLHVILGNQASSVDAALMVMEAYTDGLQHQNRDGVPVLMLQLT